MIYTQRQLEDLLKANGRLVLPCRARLTPLAADWIKHRKIDLDYSDADASTPAQAFPAQPDSAPVACGFALTAPITSATYLWWCDGPCGTTKAALSSQAKESPLAPIPLLAEPTRIGEAVKHLSNELKAGRIAGGILAVRSGAIALVLANRCPAIRAILGTCLPAIEQGIDAVAANVLVIEYPYQTLQQMKNLLARFVRRRPPLGEEMKQLIGALACE